VSLMIHVPYDSQRPTEMIDGTTGSRHICLVPLGVLAILSQSYCTWHHSGGKKSPRVKRLLAMNRTLSCLRMSMSHTRVVAPAAGGVNSQARHFNDALPSASSTTSPSPCAVWQPCPTWPWQQAWATRRSTGDSSSSPVILTGA
jgi:hypothetical protein